MKKIISIILCILLIASTMVPYASSSETEALVTIAENNNITAADSGDLQVIKWQQGTLSIDNGKFTLATNVSGNRGIILGLPKTSSLRDTVDMTKVVYTASFKLHRDDRGGNFTVEVLGYHNDSVESTAMKIHFLTKKLILW